MTYDWKADSLKSWEWAQDYFRLRKGLRRFRTVQEMYWLEMWGEVP